MHRRTVKALGEVLRQELPVRLHVGDDALADAQLAEAVALELRVETSHVQRRRVAPFEIDEDEPAPGLDRDRIELEVLHVEVRRLHAPRRRHQLPGEVVGPRVVRADDAAAREAAVLLGAQDRAAMAAGVVERPQVAGFISDDDQGLRADPRYAPVSRLGQLFLARDHHPARVPERVELALVMRRVVVPGCRQPGFQTLQRFPCHPARVKL